MKRGSAAISVGGLEIKVGRMAFVFCATIAIAPLAFTAVAVGMKKRAMTSARRRAGHRYLGERVRGGKYYGGPHAEKGKAGPARSGAPASKEPARLRLVVKPNGRWAYRFGRLR